MPSPESDQTIIMLFQSEAQQHLSALRHIVTSPRCLNKKTETGPLFRANFALRGILAMFSRSNIIPAFIDHLYRYLTHQPQSFDEFISFQLLKLIDLMARIIQEIDSISLTPEEHQSYIELQRSSLALIKNLEIHIRKKDPAYEIRFSTVSLMNVGWC
jgi:hypothetical protein